jgi:hypothetical protein
MDGTLVYWRKTLKWTVKEMACEAVDMIYLAQDRVQ